MSAPPLHIGVMLMESHGLAPNVRSTSFSSVKVWSKLYQAGPYFLDLTLGPSEQALRLRGEVMASGDSLLPTDGAVTVLDGSDTVVASTALAAGSGLDDRSFSVDLGGTGDYRLELLCGGRRISITDLAVH